LKAGVEVSHNRFLVIGLMKTIMMPVDAALIKKVNFIKELGSQLQADFFNRMEIAFVDHETIKTETMHTWWI
jgi:hypothetical protein